MATASHRHGRVEASCSGGPIPYRAYTVKRCLALLPCLLFLCCCIPQAFEATSADPLPAPDTLTPTFALMREALHEALQLRFTSAFEVAMRLEQATQRPLEAPL